MDLFLANQGNNPRVWSLINLDLRFRPLYLSKPLELTFVFGATAADFNTKAFGFSKAQYAIYKSKLAAYTEQRDAFASIISYVQETITAQNAVLI